MNSATPRVVVIAVGNPSRGDDALGPILLERIAAIFPELTLIGDFQLQIEHALDLCDADLVLFIDACKGMREATAFFEIGAGARKQVLSHALSPEAVLDVFQRVQGCPAPPAFVLALRGESFELGAKLSDSAHLALNAAWGVITPLLRAPMVADWHAYAAESTRCQASDRAEGSTGERRPIEFLAP